MACGITNVALKPKPLNRRKSYSILLVHAKEANASSADSSNETSGRPVLELVDSCFALFEVVNSGRATSYSGRSTLRTQKGDYIFDNLLNFVLGSPKWCTFLRLYGLDSRIHIRVGEDSLAPKR